MTENDLASLFNNSALFKALGFNIIEINDDAIVMEINDDNPCHQGGFGVLTSLGINGAVISAALESAIGLCGFNALGREPAGVVELSVKILRVIRKKPCRVEARVDNKNNNVAFISATLISARGGICATGTGIVLKSKTTEATQ
ncbi:putative oxidoreductase [Pectobacterium atrosepticum SCRI1043]|uniref:Oxidoreductase n=1 Tax=Pectobacterium atrosepticum (strain SCRI 1043 / ATCC BAA-672) TaxID=218491 RepID=Q6D9L3_PECAS|nr:PaaI family thioesterase [Pectobacterium atrosepticum]AIA69932.1 oxidoreductase [Pectobacterium atrosepticum]AIK12849.1 putative oxidoreductase [Pectobacterium atrosepticum]ATY89425.1 PaaI family thioesterase [Pectobacterium atrosepticum]KFX24014.1 oxidoreductase [Pectobacterium atrosepticum]MBL0893087.1 PaaI family thioesterase [Pectobacterium atrosepticum]